MSSPRGLLALRGARLADGTVADVVVDPVSAQVVSVGGAAHGDEVVDLDGFVLLPAPAEPHAHLDKALTADRVPNRSGDLLGAIEAWRAYRPRLTTDDIAERAEDATRRLLGSGCTAIRTHVDVGDDIGVRGVEALERVRRSLRDLVELQVVALASTPTTGREGAGNRAALADAMAAGADVVGGCPHLDPDPVACIELCLDLAGELGRPLDLHMDETLNPAMLTLPTLCDRVERSGFAHGATASHCVSLGVQDDPTQRQVAERCAATGVAVVALPQTNLFLQGRQQPVATPRGLTAVGALRGAGAVLAAGADNLQDPFNAMGRADPMETAALMVMAGHLLPEDAFATVSTAARRAMGLPVPASLLVRVGDPADLVAIRGPSLRAAMADAPPSRLVVRRGRVVAHDGVLVAPAPRGLGQRPVTDASRTGHGPSAPGALGSRGS